MKNHNGQYCCKACLPNEEEGILPLSPLDTSDKHRAPCPSCGAETVIGVPKCPQCGFAPARESGSPRLPRPKRSKALPPSICKECKYNLAGLKGGICPECGTPFSLFVRKEWDEEVSRETMHDAYRKPIIMIAAGLLAKVLILAIFQRWMDILNLAIIYPVSVAVSFGVAVACCAAWLGFTSSIPLMLLQIAGIHAVCSAMLTLFASLGFGGFVWSFVTGIVYIYLMAELLEMDPYDARIVAIFSAVAQVGVFVIARYYGLV